MRGTTGVSLVATLAIPSLVFATPQGSLEALLDRISKDTAKAIPVNTIPSNLSSNATTSNEPVHNPKDGGSSRMVKKKRWIWSNQIIQDDTPNAPPVGVNANLLSSNAAPVATPTSTPVAPSFAPIPLSSADNAVASAASPNVLVASESSAPASSSSVRKPHKPTPKVVKNPKESTGSKKRYVWANQIINDGDAGPPVGENVNLLSSGAPALDTPKAQLAAPTFPPLAQLSSVADKPLSAPTDVAQAGSVASSVSSRRRLHRNSKTGGAKRWVWATAIIQDDTPTSGLPSVGVNANLLSSGANVATPTATLVAPTFPSAISSVPSVAVAVASVGDVSSSAVAGVEADTEGVALISRVGASTRKFRTHATQGLKRSDHQDMAKKWYRGPSIIQDGDPAPSDDGADTPVATLVAPSFPPLSSVVAAVTSSVPTAEAPLVTSSVLMAIAVTPSASASSASADPSAIYEAVANANREALLRLRQKQHHGKREDDTSMKRVKRVN
ncbi:hypothetical protein T439DRAFT_322585 [Meredithblackwellia eburnea MCA 4105]